MSPGRERQEIDTLYIISIPLKLLPGEGILIDKYLAHSISGRTTMSVIVEKQDEPEKEIYPVGSKKVAVVIGRFNPPTKGHYAVIDQVKKFIRKNPSLGLEAAPAVVIIGGSKSDDDKKRNPLSAHERQVFMKASGRTNGVNFFVAPNAFAAFVLLRKEGLEPIAVAAGSDRVQDYMRILNGSFKNGEEPIKHYKIHLPRDESAIDGEKSSSDSVLNDMKGGDIETDLVSGSLARRAVELGYLPEFTKIVGLEDKPELAKKLFDKIAASIKE